MKYKILVVIGSLVMIALIINIAQKVRINEVEQSISKASKKDDRAHKIEVYTEENNPIDEYFNKHNLVEVNKFTEFRAGSMYKVFWQEELNHAYDALIEKANKSIKADIIESKVKFLDYAENEADITVMVKNSDAFGDETGQYGEIVHYGNVAGHTRNERLAELYKKRTIEIYNYFEYLGIQTDFIFDEKNINGEDAELFKK